MCLLLAYGNHPNITIISMSNQQRYFPEELENRMLSHKGVDYWILVDHVRVKIHDLSQLKLACDMMYVYHETLCFGEDDRDSVYTETVIQDDDMPNDLEVEEEGNNVS